MSARFHEQEVKSGLKNKRKLSAFLDSVAAKYRPKTKSTSLTYIFMSDESLLAMNRQFLDHDTLTDIITFDLSDDKEHLVGELYISTDRVKENAEKYNITYSEELHRVIFHGALHLCGFKDKKEADIKIMRQKENECLEAYNKELTK